VFVGDREVGSVEATLARRGQIWLISGMSRLGPPLDFTVNRFEAQYSDDWRPQFLSMDVATPQRSAVVNVAVQDGAALVDIVSRGEATTERAAIASDALLLPNLVFPAYEALAVRLASLRGTTQFQVFLPPQSQIEVNVVEVEPATLAIRSGSVNTIRYALLLQGSGQPVAASMWVAEGRMVRFDMPGPSIRVERTSLDGN
jgi:hypothetical protein